VVDVTLILVNLTRRIEAAVGAVTTDLRRP
jgi:hypothetical protein